MTNTPYPCRPDPLDVYLRAARWFPLSVTPFCKIGRIIHAGLSFDADGNDEDDEYNFFFRCFDLSLTLEQFY
jgi:hypothetical protein